MIVILWLALFLRVWQLDTLPPGLHYDEAFNGTMARDVLRGINRPVFFTPNFGEEPLHIYTEALLFSLLGESPWTIRLVSAIFGVIFVAALYAAARALFPKSGWAALVSAFIAATLYWAINFSRIGIETNGLPMLLTLSAAALGHTYRKMSWQWVVSAGFLIGATLYTYLASRLWLAAVFLWFAYLFVFHRASIRAHFSRWVVIGLVAVLTLAPLISFFAVNPVAFAGRSGTVFTPEIFVTNLVRTAGMFWFSGDTDPRDNLPLRPALDVLLGIFFLIGLGVALIRFRQPFYALLLIWLVIMCLPSALTEFAPNFRRAIGAMPAMILLCAVAVDWLAHAFDKFINFSTPSARNDKSRDFVPDRLFKCSLIAALLVSAFWSVRAYFVDWAGGTGLYYSFDAGLLQVAQSLAARPAGQELYLTPKYDEHYTVIWALDGRPVSSFDGRRVLVLPDSSRAATYGIITREDNRTLTELGRAQAATQKLAEFVDYRREPYAQVVQLETGEKPSSAPAIRLGEFAELTNYTASPSVPKRDEKVMVQLGWQATGVTDKNYTVFMQLLGPTNPTTGTNVWAQSDGQPGDGTFPTSAWRPGQSIAQTYELKVPPEAIPGTYSIVVGMYLLETGERVPLLTADGAPVTNNAIQLMSFEAP